MAPGIADKKNNSLPIWGNEKTMNLNNLILTNILSSHYFKVNLYQLKTYHEVIDEIYYKVSHLEPWEKGSRKTSGQTGMCGGVRGVGAGGIVSTAYCILYKLFTLKLTRKQVVGLINHNDSPYIRALGFMYIRYTQPPADLWDWYEPYLEDDEEVDVKAGGGLFMSVGEMLRHFLSKLEWFSTLFPRIPVPIQKDLESKLSDWRAQNKGRIHSVSEQVTAIEGPESTSSAVDEDAWEDVRVGRRYSHDRIVKDFEDGEELDISEAIKREQERQRRERESHGSSSKYHHSPGWIRKVTIRERSRSPVGSKCYKDDLRKHESRHHESPRYRDHDSYRSSPRYRAHEFVRSSSPRYRADESDRSSPRYRAHESDRPSPRYRAHESDRPSPRYRAHESDRSSPRYRVHESDRSSPRRRAHESDRSSPRHKSHESDRSSSRQRAQESDRSSSRQRAQESDRSSSPRYRSHEDDRSSPPRYRDHGSHRQYDSDKFYKDKYVRREVRLSTSHSYSPDRRSNRSHSRSRDRH